MQKKILNRKGQVGEGVTWIIATIIIIAILVFFIFVASSLGKARTISLDIKKSVSSNKEIERLPFDEREVEFTSNLRIEDSFLRKSLYTYFKISNLQEKLFLENYLKELNSKGKFRTNYEEVKLEMEGFFK